MIAATGANQHTHPASLITRYRPIIIIIVIAYHNIDEGRPINKFLNGIILKIFAI